MFNPLATKSSPLTPAMPNLLCGLSHNDELFVHDCLYWLGDTRQADDSNVFYVAEMDKEQITFISYGLEGLFKRGVLPEDFVLRLDDGKCYKGDACIYMGYDTDDIHPIFEDDEEGVK